MTRTTHAPARRTGRARPRRGVTLVELLVVIAILTVLLALTSAAVMKTKASAANNRTSEYVVKLQKALGGEVERVNARAGNGANVPAALLAYADGNAQRARAINVAVEQLRYFPQTFAEATSDVYLIQNGSSLYRFAQVAMNKYPTLKSGESVLYTWTHLKHFEAVFPLVTATDTYAANQESGALLYVILSQASAAGGGAMAAAADDLTAAQKLNVTLGGTQLATFADGFQNSIGFSRWYAQAEVQSAPYAVSGAGGNADPLDPQNLCYGWAAYNPTAQADGNTKAQQVYNLLQFANQNRVTTAYSYGANGTADKVPDVYGNDDVFGFRTSQPGNKGFHP
jgi:prepilin-type N-terminal cleavage/methylation domain-containing protein